MDIEKGSGEDKLWASFETGKPGQGIKKQPSQLTMEKRVMRFIC